MTASCEIPRCAITAGRKERLSIPTCSPLDERIGGGPVWSGGRRCRDCSLVDLIFMARKSLLPHHNTTYHPERFFFGSQREKRRLERSVLACNI